MPETVGANRYKWLGRIGLVLTSSGLTFVLAALGVIYIYRAKQIDVPRFIRALPLVQRTFVDPNFEDFMDLVSVEWRGSFETTWDTNDPILLHRDLFEPVEMFGEKRYRYRPEISMYAIRIWTGLRALTVDVRDTPEIAEALGRCKVLFGQRRIETDEYGFRKTEFPVEVGRPTVFFLGDSFTEGLLVESHRTFVNLWGRAARREGFDVVPVNLGVNGYGSLEMAWSLEKFAPEFKPSLVIANVYPNDVQSDGPAVLRGEAPESAWVTFLSYLDRMKKYCDLHGIVFCVTEVPARELMSEMPGPDVFRERVASWCQRNQVPFIDPLETFRAAGERLYFTWDVHFNSAGHAAYAQVLFDGTQEFLVNE